MIKRRVIPILLYDGEYCVQTTRFKRPVRRLGPITQYVNNMADRDIDELILIDITATEENRVPNFNQIKKFTEKLFCPVTYGGGIKHADEAKKLIQECGVDKIAIKTSYKIIESMAKVLGKQAVVCAMDCYPHHSNGTHFVHRMSKEVGLYKYVSDMQSYGVGEILLTCMEHQGQMLGYNYLLINQVSKYCKVPLIVNGGCGKVGHMEGAFEVGADAVAGSSVFCLTDLTPRDAARALGWAGIPTRLDKADRRQ